MLAVLQHALAVDPDVPHADRELMRILERGPVTDCFRIKDDDVREFARLQQAAIAQGKSRGNG